MKIRGIIPLVMLLCCVLSQAQNRVADFIRPSDSLNTIRRNSVLISEAALSSAAFIALDQIWYADYPRSSFHFKNDNAEWLQMDKAGHAFTSYHLSEAGTSLLRWSGVNKKQSAIYGTASGFAFLTIIEVFDGFSSQWGASTGDITANAGGALLYLSQELLWKEQRIITKFSFHTTPYASARPEVLGSNLAEQVLKDYNGQTYWLSANLHSFIKADFIPKWLNVAVGYGAEGMITGDDALVNTVFLPEHKRYRQFYLSFDADLTKIETKSAILRTLFRLVNTIKVPAPALEINGKGITKIHALYF
ncbi:MAG: DUF2279 domain-containing protein [Flavobacterium sp.]|nr:MAG: DUF2279 domain-containing protein [Flavobacterium sp.]